MKKRKLTKKQQLCLACQKCCKELFVYTHPLLYDCSAEELVNFYRTRGFDVAHLEEDAVVLSFKHTCQHLTPQGCDIYDERPLSCAQYSGLEDFGDECLWSTLDGEDDEG